MVRALPVVVSLLALAGCARFADADRDARATALAVHKQALHLKQAVRLKVEAEERYYRASVKTLDQSRELRDFTDILRALRARARATATELQKSPEAVDAMLPARLEREALETAIILEDGVAARREQRETMRQNLAALRDLQAEYAMLEETLLQLSTPSGEREQLKSLFNFLEQAAAHYRKLQEADREAAANAKKGTP